MKAKLLIATLTLLLTASCSHFRCHHGHDHGAKGCCHSECCKSTCKEKKCDDKKKCKKHCDKKGEHRCHEKHEGGEQATGEVSK